MLEKHETIDNFMILKCPIYERPYNTDQSAGTLSTDSSNNIKMAQMLIFITILSWFCCKVNTIFFKISQAAMRKTLLMRRQVSRQSDRSLENELKLLKL